jgi:hypothetical protein
MNDLDGNGTVTNTEIALVAVLNGVAVGAFAAGDFFIG